MAHQILGRDPTGLPRDINVSATGDLYTVGTASMMQAGTITMLQAGTVSKLQSGTISMVQAGTVFARPEVTWGTILSGTCTGTGTEYPVVLPANCRQFEIQARTEASFRIAFLTGKVATPTESYLTLKAGDYFVSPPLLAANGTVFLASATAGTEFEIVAWT